MIIAAPPNHPVPARPHNLPQARGRAKAADLSTDAPMADAVLTRSDSAGRRPDTNDKAELTIAVRIEIQGSA